MQPQFSIIVPCCGVEPYAEEMIASVKAQGGEWECLLVVEESLDDTLDTLKRLTDDDARFRLFTQKRSGSPAAPRNTGLEHASGDFVIFLDGDDWLAEGALVRLAERIAQHPGGDIYPCALREWQEDEAGNRQQAGFYDNFSNISALEWAGCDALLDFDRHNFIPLALAQLLVCRRSFLNANKLRFMHGLVHEEEEFFPRAFYYASKVVPLHEVIYEYRHHPHAITTAPDAAKRELDSVATILRSLFRFHAKVSREPDFDVKLTDCWRRRWFGVLARKICDAKVGENFPPEHRLNLLRSIFSDGFHDLRRLVHGSSFMPHLAAALLKLGVRTGWLKAVELFARIVEGGVCEAGASSDAGGMERRI